MIRLNPEQRATIAHHLQKVIDAHPNTLTQEARTTQAVSLLLSELHRISSQSPVDPFGDVFELHEKKGMWYDGSPRHLPEDMHKHRLGFLREELDEYEAAYLEGDLNKQFDAILDLIYVAIGTLQWMGLAPVAREGWDRVHAANMLREPVKSAKESKRGFHTDLKKPEGWVHPDLSDLVK